MRAGGILIGDDYGSWREVRRAFDDFFRSLGLPIEHKGNKCMIIKSAASA